MAEPEARKDFFDAGKGETTLRVGVDTIFEPFGIHWAFGKNKAGEHVLRVAAWPSSPALKIEPIKSPAAKGAADAT